MKIKLLQIAFVLISLKAKAQVTDCYNTPTGTDGSGWSYIDYVIPPGYKLDSVHMDATSGKYRLTHLSSGWPKKQHSVA